MKIITNKKALSSLIVLLIIAAIIIGLVAAAFSLGSGPEASNNGDITVYLDSQKQTGNYTEPQTLTWADVQAGHTYTKNFTVANNGANTYNLILLTSEPAGTSQGWAYNNTVIGPVSYSAGDLTLALSLAPSTGSYSWRLLTTNSTMPSPTPTVGPSSTPIPNSLQFTIKAETGIQNVTITYNTQAPFTLNANQLPKTYTVTPGDNIKLEAGTSQYYNFNGWQFDDGTLPHMSNPIVQANIQANFTVTATAIMTQP